MINNRQNGRRRGRGGQQRPQGGGGQGSRDSGNRIDSRARGNASQLYEKYKNMASDAQRQGDRVTTEYYLQFADHYFRVMADQRGRYEEQQPRRQQPDFDSDDEFGDEGEPIRAEEQSRGGDERGERDGNRQGDNGRQQEGYRQRDDRRPRADDNRQRDDNRQGDNRQRDEQGGRQRYGNGRPAEPRVAETAIASEQRDGRTGAVESDATQAQPFAPTMAQEGEPARGEMMNEAAAAPKRRGRPRKVVPEAGEQLGLDSSVLPPSIGVSDAGEQGAAPKPRRRRTPAPVEVASS